MIQWQYNENVKLELPEASLKAFNGFIGLPQNRIFIPQECITAMRKKFKKDFNLTEEENEKHS